MNEITIGKTTIEYCDNCDKDLIEQYVKETNPLDDDWSSIVNIHRRDGVLDDENCAEEKIYRHRYLSYIVKFKILGKKIQIIEFKSHKILTYFEESVKVLKQMSLVASTADHSVNIGTTRENIIENFLKKIMPKSVDFYTGELIDKNNDFSGQLDIIIHSVFSPKFNLFSTIDIFPVETVIGVLEIKSKLNQQKLMEACNSYKKIKELKPKTEIVPPFLVLAFESVKQTSTIKSYIASSFYEKDIIVISLDSKKPYYIATEVGLVEKKEGEVLLYLFKELLKLSSSGTKENVFDVDDYFENVKPIEQYLF